MENQNFFALLGDNDGDAPTIIANIKTQAPPAPIVPPVDKKNAPPAKLPTKPLPPSEAVKESQRGNDRAPRGGRRGGRSGPGRDGYEQANGDGFGRGDRGAGRGYNRGSDENNPEGFRGRGRGRGPVRGGRGRGESQDIPTNEETEEAPGGEERGRDVSRGRGNRYNGYNGPASGRRPFDRRSGTGRSTVEMKRDGAGRGNWGTVTDAAVTAEAEAVVKEDEPSEVVATEDKTPVEEKEAAPAENTEAKKEEDNEMSLEEYEKLLEEKRKNLLALKTEERKVEVDKSFEAMKLVDKKAVKDFIKLGSEKEKTKKADGKDNSNKVKVTITEFLKNHPRRGSFRGGRGGGGPGSFNSRRGANVEPGKPEIEDPTQFPSLGGGK